MDKQTNLFNLLTRNHKAVISRLRMLRRYRGNPGHPNIIHLAITDKCNMSCAFCLYRKDNKNFNIIDAEKAESLIKEINSPIVLLSGGEPLIHGEILDTTRRIAGLCRELGKITGVLTNGVTLKNVLSKRFPEFKPGSRFFFQISIDGLKEEHDRLRGNFDLIMKNIEYAKEAGHLVYTNTVIGQSNVHALHEIADFLAGFSDRIYLNPMVNNKKLMERKGIETLGNFITENQDVRIGNSVNYGKFLSGERSLKCMFHSLVSITPSGKIKFPCYCYGEGAEYMNTFEQFLSRVYREKDIFENKQADQCKSCYTHCLHEADVYARYYWNEILEQARRPLSLYKKYVVPIYRPVS